MSKSWRIALAVGVIVAVFAATSAGAAKFITGGDTGEVRCPDGMVAVGGTVSPGNLFTTVDLPSADGRGWAGAAVGPNGEAMRIVVICTPGSATVLPTGS